MKKNIKRFFIKFHWILATQLGIDPLILFRSLKGISFFLRDKAIFKNNYNGVINLMPCLHDRFEEGGVTKNEYFWQDLIVARLIFDSNPRKHLDVGSRIDGFVAHVASFREIDLIDIRPVDNNIPGINFHQHDFMQDPTEEIRNKHLCDSLSCLHALEHFGLGRYGDPVNPDGYKLGIHNLTYLLESGGTFYLSTPIGKERVEFNANWVFNPKNIINLVKTEGFTLEKFFTFGSGKLIERSEDDEVLNFLSDEHYNLGIFVFKKNC